MRFEQLAHRKPRSIPAGGGRLFRFANSHFAGKRIIRHLGMDCAASGTGGTFSVQVAGQTAQTVTLPSSIATTNYIKYTIPRFGFCEQRRNDLVYIVERTSVDQYR